MAACWGWCTGGEGVVEEGFGAEGAGAERRGAEREDAGCAGGGNVVGVVFVVAGGGWFDIRSC